jgi:methyl-accepting chemotaxis protein
MKSKLGMKGKMLMVSLLPFILVMLVLNVVLYVRLKSLVAASELTQLVVGLDVVMVVLMIVVAVIVILVVNSMVRSVNRLVSIMVYMIKGDLTQSVQEVDLNRSDELGMFAKGVDKIRQSLVDVVGKIHSTTDILLNTSEQLDRMTEHTGSAADEVANAMSEMSSGATAQAADTQKVNREIDAMSRKIEQTNTEVELLNENSAQMKAAGEQGISVVENLEKISEKVKSEIAVIHEQTNVTNESAQKIRQATELIASIASETNLLSLNASIEAARAGESGRGFAVVADQIKTLSEQSNASVISIEEIISDLLEDSENAVATMERVNDIIDRQNQEVGKTKQAFTVVNDGLVQSAVEVDRIAENTNTLEQSTDVVVDAMTNLSSVAEVNATTTESTAAATEELTATIGEIAEQAAQLHTLADSLKEDMSMFRLA